MRAGTFTVASIVLVCVTAAAAPLVTYESPCECRDNHGKHRWSEKNDPALPPTDASAIQAVTPSDIFSWQGPTEYLVPSSERIWSEQKWCALTGRVVDLRAEADGDLHIALQDATSDKPGMVVVEIPAKPQWCELREIVFGWTQVQFPFRVRSGRKLKRNMILPDGAVELMINLGDPQKLCVRNNPAKHTIFRQSWISGERTMPIVIDEIGYVHLVGVRLRAGGAWPFLGIPLREFTDQVVELETIMGRDIEDLRDTLCEARDDDSRFDLLDRGLVAGLLRKRAWRF
jgi:hypothetical protein